MNRELVNRWNAAAFVLASAIFFVGIYASFWAVSLLGLEAGMSVEWMAALAVFFAAYAVLSQPVWPPEERQHPE